MLVAELLQVTGGIIILIFLLGNVDLRELNRENEEYEKRLNQSLTYGETRSSSRQKRPLAITYEENEGVDKTYTKRGRRSL